MTGAATGLVGVMLASLAVLGAAAGDVMLCGAAVTTVAGATCFGLAMRTQVREENM